MPVNEPGLAAAQRRLGKPGRPRTAPDNGHTAGTSAPGTRANSGPQGRALVSPAIAPRLLDVEGSAAYLSVSPWTIRDLRAAGRLRAVKLPLEGDRECRRLLFDRRDLDALVETSKEPT